MKKIDKKCATPHCRHKPRGKFCNTCWTRQWRAENPVQSSFLNLKHNAKRRRVYFDLTTEEFKEFCSGVKYIGFAGRKSDSLTMHRVINDHSIGYRRSNIAVLPKGENVKIYFEYDYQTKSIKFTNATDQQSDHGPNPF